MGRYETFGAVKVFMSKRLLLEEGEEPFVIVNGHRALYFLIGATPPGLSYKIV